MKSFLLTKWLRDVPLTRKLYFVVGIMALLIAVELFMLSFMIHTLSATRALVGAEGLWSKAEKDAVYSLTKYGYTHNEADYTEYLSHLKVPMGDHKTRLELLKHNPDLSIAREGFMEGRVHPDDIDGAIELLLRFHNISYIKKIATIWAQGDQDIAQLQYLGTRLHTEVSLGKSPPDEITHTLDEIYMLNASLTVLEDNFSYTLGEGSRWIEHLILEILFSIAMTVEFTGLFLTISVSTAISRGINEIVRVASNVSTADFSSRATVYSKDEIGVLATSFNHMIDDLQQKINEENEAKAALSSQKDLYETLINAQSEMGEGVCITEGEKIVYVNEAVCRIYGYSREEILNLPSFLAVVPEDERTILAERLKQRTTGERIQSSGETRVIRKDGKVLNIEYSVRNMRADGHMQMIAIIRDITAKKQSEERLRKETARAESAEIAKKIGEQFLANMSHEIRTPMNAIVGFTDILKKTGLTPEQLQYLDAIKTSGENLLVIINDILDFSRIRSGKMPIEQKEFRLSQIIATCKELMLPKALGKKLDISTYIDADIPDNLIGDPTRLTQVLLNLTANAIKFTEIGGVCMTVNKLTEQNNKVELQFLIEDTGIGIEQEKLATIFDAFTQANNDTARKYGGTGLGLAIVKQLAELQGGSVSVNSETGKGSCFTFRISYEIDTAPAGKADETMKELPVTVRELNVLLAEDNAMNQLLVKKVLNDWGWNVEIADNGKKAIELIKRKDFDMVLMDIQLPEMDGYDTARAIRKLPAPKGNVPIIAMTAHVMQSEEQKCYETGMNDYISKPFNTKALYNKVVAAIHQ